VLKLAAEVERRKCLEGRATGQPQRLTLGYRTLRKIFLEPRHHSSNKTPSG